MQTRQQNVDDLSTALKRISDGDGYMVRLEQLIARAAERGEATADLSEYLEGMRVLMQSFKTNRDLLIQAIKVTDPKD
jgi:hypothetical protein